jgi:hypothetical protein
VAANDYHFITTWRIAATPDEITAVLGDAASLARWWPSVDLEVRVLEPGDANGLGKVVELWTKGFLPYTFDGASRSPNPSLPPASGLTSRATSWDVESGRSGPRSRRASRAAGWPRRRA